MAYHGQVGRLPWRTGRRAPRRQVPARVRVVGPAAGCGPLGPGSPLQLLPRQQRRPRQAAGLGGAWPGSKATAHLESRVCRAGFAEHHHFSRAVCSSCRAQAKPLRALHGPPTVCCLVPEAPWTLWPFSWLGFPRWALRQVKCWVARGLVCFPSCHPAWPSDFTSCPPSSLLTSKSKASPGLASGVG